MTSKYQTNIVQIEMGKGNIVSYTPDSPFHRAPTSLDRETVEGFTTAVEWDLQALYSESVSLEARADRLWIQSEGNLDRVQSGAKALEERLNVTPETQLHIVPTNLTDFSVSEIDLQGQTLSLTVLEKVQYPLDQGQVQSVTISGNPVRYANSADNILDLDDRTGFIVDQDYSENNSVALVVQVSEEGITPSYVTAQPWGAEQVTVYTDQGQDWSAWEPGTLVRSLKITVVPSEGQRYYGLRTLHLGTMQYGRHGTVEVQKPWTYNRVQFTCDQQIPANTSVTHYLSTDQDHWLEVESGDTLYLQGKSVAVSTLSTYEPLASVDRCPFWQTGATVGANADLYRGHNQFWAACYRMADPWTVEESQATRASVALPGPNNWNPIPPGIDRVTYCLLEPGSLRTSLISLSPNGSLLLNANFQTRGYMYHLWTHFWANRSVPALYTVQNRYIDSTTDRGVALSIYLNDKSLYPTYGLISNIEQPLYVDPVSGWNRLDFYLWRPLVATLSTELATVTFNPFRQSVKDTHDISIICAERDPLKKVSKSYLYCQAPRTPDWYQGYGQDYYALESGHVVLNYDPETPRLLETPVWGPGLSDYVATTRRPTNLRVEENSSWALSSTLYVRSVLQGDGTYTPTISGYTLKEV